MNLTQAILHSVEEGKARILTRLIPFFVALLVILLVYDFNVFIGLDDPQSMDNAQLARQIERGDGYTTKFLRPAALAQMNSLAAATRTAGAPTAFYPDAKYPEGTERLLPDTYNAPGYPYLLSSWYSLLRTNFDQTPKEIASSRFYAGDRPIPWLNQIFVLLTAGLIFLLGRGLFDHRVAWMAMTSFLLTNIVWQYSITALSTSVLMFLVTILCVAAVEIYAVGEACFASDEARFWPAWVWTLLLGLVLGLACLTRLQLLALLVPFALFFIFVPRGSYFLMPFLALIVIGIVAPWFWHMYKISGSPVGSNVSFLHYGAKGNEGNQIFCAFVPPDNNQLFKDVTGKEFTGFGWHFAHAWDLLGANPMVLLFFAAILHQFKRLQVQALRWLLIACGFVLILATNFGSACPAPVDTWNAIVLLLPGMLVIGSAYFFILLDRLHLQLKLMANAITVTMLVLISCPLAGTMLNSHANHAYPPYVPPAIKAIGLYVKPGEWITTDMPWATAWYGDHPSMWLPDSLADFNVIYDDYNSSGLLLLTPVLLSQPITSITSGEDKDWFPFVARGSLPPHFPLDSRIPLGSAMIEYMIWGRAGGL
jgi:hypothetical protein